MISLFVNFVAKPGRGKDLLDVLNRALAQAQQEPGTLIYTISTERKNDDAIWLFELYEDSDALKAHSSSDVFKQVGEELKELLDQPAQIKMTVPQFSKGTPDAAG